MPGPNQIDVWHIPLDDPALLFLPPVPAESERAARFHYPHLAERYLRAHAALRAILGRYTQADLDFAAGEHGKPYLTQALELQFNLSHSKELALVAVAFGVPVGVDVERLRAMPDCLSVAERFFPAVEAAELAGAPADRREREFFRLWTRIEAVLKARGVGLFGAGTPPEEDWIVQELDVGPDYAAAVAAPRPGRSVTVHHYAGFLLP